MSLDGGSGQLVVSGMNKIGCFCAAARVAGVGIGIVERKRDSVAAPAMTTTTAAAVVCQVV